MRLIAQINFLDLCEPLNARELYQLGIKAKSVSGLCDPEVLQDLKDVVSEHPHLHIASLFDYINGVNRPVENAAAYYLCKGESAADIVIVKWLPTQDFSDAEAYWAKAWQQVPEECFLDLSKEQ